MSGLQYVPLSHRAVIRLGGEDRIGFLQGLISADVPRVENGVALYGAMLTPQGKFLHELFIAADGDTLLLDTDADRRADLVKKLSMYKLRSKVSVAAEDAVSVFALWGDDVAKALGLTADVQSFAGGVVWKDPRLPQAGYRAALSAEGVAALQAAGFQVGNLAVWDQARIGLGLPDGGRDLIPEKSLLLENGFDELYGVDFKKGCYMGQELTARTKYRALIKKRLLPVSIEGGDAPPPGTQITADGAEAGELRSTNGTVGLALVRLDALRGAASLQCGAVRVIPTVPNWVVLPTE